MLPRLISPIKTLFLYLIPKSRDFKNSMVVIPIGIRQLNLGSE